jgi:hypothetical protein
MNSLHRGSLHHGSIGRLCAASVCSLALAALLTGCQGGFNQYVNPSPPPTPAAVYDEFNAFNIAWSNLRQAVVKEGNDPTPAAREAADKTTAQYFVSHGYDLAATNCILYFDRIRNLRNETNFTKDLLVSIAAASGLVAGLAGASAAALTAIIGGTGIIPRAVDDFNKTFLLSDIADAVSPAIHTGMASYREAHKPENATQFDAAQLVREHARICTVPFMLDVAKKGIGNTTIVSNKPETTTGTTTTTTSGSTKTTTTVTGTTTDGTTTTGTTTTGATTTGTPRASTTLANPGTVITPGARVLGVNGAMTIQSIQ